MTDAVNHGPAPDAAHTFAQAAEDGAEVALTAWAAERERAVRGPRGGLALVRTEWFERGLSEAEADERVREAAAELSSHRESSGQPEVTRHQRRDATTGEITYAVRFWDAQSPAAQAFIGIDRFAPNEEFVFDAHCELVQDRTQGFSHVNESGERSELIPADVVWERDGETVRLAVWQVGDALTVVFADASTGQPGDGGSYAPGRFLALRHPADPSRLLTAEDLVEGAPARLDFNYATLPPCAFSPQWNCPMPPAQNRLPFAVTAGERQPVFAEGCDPYAAFA